MPSPVLLKTPGAVPDIATLPRAGKPSGFVTDTSAAPISDCGGTTKIIWAGDTKRISAARPLIVTLVPATLVGKVPSLDGCDCAVAFARLAPCAAAMLPRATDFV